MNVIAYPEQISQILATIRYMESRGNYTIPPNKGNASGAYQFIASTWGNYGGYPHSNLAPPAIQDERAAADVTRFLAQWNYDVSMIPVMWYYPIAARKLELMDVVPVPSAGNRLTVREYQQRWLGVWASISGQPIPQIMPSASKIPTIGSPPDPLRDARGTQDTIAFPVLGPARLASPSCGVTESEGAESDSQIAGLCSATAPGIAFGVKLQPVLAVVDGVVTAVENSPGETISVTITDDTGRSFELAGFNDDNPGTNDGLAPDYLRLSALATVGTTVRAGQVIGFMGDTDPLPAGVRSDVPTAAGADIPDNAIAPHIRLTITELDGTEVDAYGPVIDALFRQVCTVGTGPWSGPPNGTDRTPVTVATASGDPQVASAWTITADGQVTASGWAAIIYPSESCPYSPPEPVGPGAGGDVDVPTTWATPIDISTSIWISVAAQDEDPHELTRPGALLLRG